MKIVLESEMEVKLWSILLAAHYKWEKNHGDSIRGQMEWYFFDLYKEETNEIIKNAVDARLNDEYGESGLNVIGVTEEKFIREGLANNDDDELDPDELELVKSDLVQEYKNLIDEYEEEKNYLPSEIEDKIRSFYYTFFNAPENLIVEYNGEIIQKSR